MCLTNIIAVCMHACSIYDLNRGCGKSLDAYMYDQPAAQLKMALTAWRARESKVATVNLTNL